MKECKTYLYLLMQAGKRSKALSLFRQGIKENNFSEVNVKNTPVDVSMICLSLELNL
jgi:hypothetical protein